MNYFHFMLRARSLPDSHHRHSKMNHLVLLVIIHVLATSTFSVRGSNPLSQHSYRPYSSRDKTNVTS